MWLRYPDGGVQTAPALLAALHSLTELLHIPTAVVRCGPARGLKRAAHKNVSGRVRDRWRLRDVLDTTTLILQPFVG